MFTRIRADRDLVLTLFFVALTAALWFTPTGFENRVDETAVRSRARIVATDNSRILQFGILKTGWQTVSMELLEGPFKGSVVEGDNQLLGKLEMDKIFMPGDDALAVITTTEEGGISRVNPQDHYRLDTELLLLGLFAALLLLFGGTIGAKALLSFVFTGLCIWKLLIPGLLRGHDPIPLTLGLVAVLCCAIIFLVGGLTRKGTTALLGSLLGLAVTCAMALLAAPAFRLHGAIKPFSESLLYTGFGYLDLTRIFLSGIFLASAGAVMDLAMDVAASQHEVIQARPQTTFGQALRAGFCVGRAVTGTMTTTLLLAYSGGYTMLLMVFMAQGVPPASLFNLSFVAAEFVHTLVGSIGLVTTAPLTALIGAFIFTRAPRPAATTERLPARPEPCAAQEPG